MRPSIWSSHSRPRLASTLLLVGSVVSVLPALARPMPTGQPGGLSRAAQRDAPAIREVLEANFQACNHENVDAVVATLSKTMPRVPEFAKEAKDTFEHTDAYFRLADFELLEYRPPYALARVVQITVPRDEKDRTTGTDQQIFYRGRSGLLPQWECVEYLQGFRREGGKWKVHLINSEPKAAVWPPGSEPAIRTDDMPAR